MDFPNFQAKVYAMICISLNVGVFFYCAKIYVLFHYSICISINENFL